MYIKIIPTQECFHSQLCPPWNGALLPVHMHDLYIKERVLATAGAVSVKLKSLTSQVSDKQTKSSSNCKFCGYLQLTLYN